MSDDDKPKLTPANENPWYWLATVYGEQEEGAKWRNWDRDLAAKNREAWNRWMAVALSEGQRSEVIANGIREIELSPRSGKELNTFLKEFAARAGNETAMPPDPRNGVDFRGVHFERSIVFNHFVFPTAVDFTLARFSHSADFCKAVFFVHADFTRAAFYGGADFLRTRLNSVTDFTEAEFHTYVPDFRDAKMPEAIQGYIAKWPPPPTNEGDAPNQVYAYERLKAEMERLKKHDDEQFFFAKELRARRALETRLSPKWLLNWAYETFSGYGLSAERPIFWLVILFALGAGYFALTPARNNAPLPIDVAAGLSFTNIFSLLPYKPKIEELSTCAKIIGDIQSVLGLILLFLLGLALRNRFRMK